MKWILLYSWWSSGLHLGWMLHAYDTQENCQAVAAVIYPGAICKRQDRVLDSRTDSN